MQKGKREKNSLVAGAFSEIHPDWERWRGQLAQENREKHTQTKRKEPECGCRCPHRTKAAQLPRGGSGIKKQRTRIAAIEQKEDECSYSAVDQVPEKGRKQSRGGVSTPIANPREQ